VDVDVADLDEQRAGVGEQFSGQHGSFVDAVEVRVDAVAVAVSEGSQRHGVADGQAVELLGGFELGDRGLEVGLEVLAIRRVEVDHLDLVAQAVLGEQRLHHRSGVAVDEAVLPVTGMLVPLPFECVVAEPVEVELHDPAGVTAAQLLHQQRGGDLLAGVQRHAGEGVRGVGFGVAVDLRGDALAVPRQHRVGAQVAVEVHVAELDCLVVGVGDGLRQASCHVERDRRTVVVAHQRRGLRGGLVRPLRRGMVVGARLSVIRRRCHGVLLVMVLRRRGRLRGRRDRRGGGAGGWRR